MVKIDIGHFQQNSVDTFEWYCAILENVNSMIENHFFHFKML